MIIVKDLIRDVVKNVSTELTATLKAYDSNIKGVQYMNGHPLEIVNRLVKREDNGMEYDKYPLIALFMDFPETIGNDFGSVEVNLHLAICRDTDPNLITDERYDVNFKPVLYPVYESFLKQLTLFKYGKWKPFLDYDVSQIQHRKIDRPFWGRETFLKNEANFGTDYLDAIEIRDLKLKINLKNC